MPAFLITIAGWFGVSAGRLIAYAVAVIAIVIAVLGFVKHERDIGRQDALKKIEDANTQAEGQANAGQKTLDKCLAAGGVWDRTDGVCLTVSGH